MELPASVKIGPYTYTVAKEGGIRSSHDDSKLFGEIDYRRHLIRIDEGLTHDRAYSTFLHECVHGLAELVCIDLEEREIDALSTALFSFLVDNDMLKGPA